MGEAKLTVIVPVFDRDETLRRAVASIVSQSDSVSVVIVDDGSAPQFAAVADELGASSGGIVEVVHQPNRGPAAARNVGLIRSRSPYVLFLDSDDELTETALAVLDHYLQEREDVGMVCGATRIVSPVAGVRIKHPEPNPVLPWAMLNQLAGSFAVRAEVAHAVGGYDEALRYSENSDFVMRLAQECHRRSLIIAATSEVFCIHYEGADERRYDGRRLEAAIHLLHRGRFDLELSSKRAALHGIAAVNAGRLGRYRLSVKHAALAALTEPRNPRHFLRLAFSLTGPVAKHRWLRT